MLRQMELAIEPVLIFAPSDGKALWLAIGGGA
jgi:hypothetical protein